MEAERARLKRLLRLERIRAIAKQSLAVESARAEGTLAQLEALADRTRQLACDYAGRREPVDGLALRQLGEFMAGLEGISTSTRSDAATARAVADAKLEALALAERRRAAVESRAEKQARHIAAHAVAPQLGTRRGFGTSLE